MNKKKYPLKSTMSSSRISSSDSLRNEAREGEKSVTILDEIFRENIDNTRVDDSEDPREIISRAEALARENEKRMINGTKRSSRTISSKREYAQALHRQADLLHHKGDYEMALVLYHRAASACPRENSHGIAARRTAAAISSATNPPRALKKSLPETKNVAQLVGISCPETAARRAKKIVEESADPVSAIDQILKYFDSRKDFLRNPPIFRDRRRTTLVSRSRTMLRQLGSIASVTLENLQAAFASGDFAASLRIGNELLAIAEPLVDRYRYEVAARHYLAMIEISLGRHDRAIDQVTLMIRSAKKSNDMSLRSRSFMTLGRVHLTFGHLDAAARAWERLAGDVEDAVPRAWLYHEIGRCYFELKRHGSALEMSYRCREYADEGNSSKWLLNGKLLSGQALVELGRFGEAVLVLREARKIAANSRDNETREYIDDLIDRITITLRRAVCTDEIIEANKTRNDNNVAEKNVSRAKSENMASWETQDFVSSREINDNFVAETRLKTTIRKCRDKRFESTGDSGRKNCRIATSQGRRKNTKEIVKNSIYLSASEESEIFDDGSTKNDDTDFTDNSDEAKDELLTSRTRVLETKNRDDESSIDEYLDENEFARDRERNSDDGEPTNRTGKTYVLNEPSL